MVSLSLLFFKTKQNVSNLSITFRILGAAEEMDNILDKWIPITPLSPFWEKRVYILEIFIKAFKEA